MNKKGQLNIGIFVMLFVTVVLGIALLVPIFNTQSTLTDKQSSVNDSINTASSVAGSGQVNITDEHFVTNYYAVGDYRNTECPITGVTLTNSSGTEYTATTDYVFNTAYGNFTLKNTAKVNQSVFSDNLTYVSYTYCAAGWSPDAGSRTTAGMIGLFTTIALLAALFVGLKNDLFDF